MLAILEQARAHKGDYPWLVDSDRRQVLPGRGRLLLVWRALGRYAQGQRPVGFPGGGGGGAGGASAGLGSRRGGPGGQRWSHQAAGVRRASGGGRAGRRAFG